MPDNSQDNKASPIEISDSEFSAALSPSDLKGRINLRVDQALQKEIEDIAEDSRYPLNSASEVIRYCCILGVKRLREWKPGKTLLSQIRMASELVSRDRIQCDSLQLLERLDERMNWYIQNAHYDEAIDLIARVRGYFDNLDDFWAMNIQTEIDNKFAVYMDRIDMLRKD